MIQDHLFYTKGSLRDCLERHRLHFKKEVENLEPNYLLNVSEEDLCKYFLEKYLLESPTLKEDEICISNQSEVDIDVSRDWGRAIHDRSRPYYIKGVSITIAIPFNGESELFHFQPSHSTLNPPRGETNGQEVHLKYETIDYDEQKFKQAYTHELGEIKRYLVWVKEEIDSFNETLEPLVKETIKNRKNKILKDQGLVSSLGIPIRHSENLSRTYTIFANRRVPPFERPKATIEPFNPEPSLSEEEYEYILEIINNMALIMERSPKTFSKLKEEEIRDHFIFSLNGHYEGQATGETFNYEGKTDILIRHKEKNVFIAECKFWKGEQELREAIDQLFRYTSWRDTKTAILLFNKNKNFSSILNKIETATKSHSCYKREFKLKNKSLENETIFSYIFHQPNDINREVVLTILAFDVPI